MNALARISDPSIRRSIEDEIERLISLLDLLDPDPDLEPYLADGAEHGGDDREGDTSDDEDSLGWTRTGAFGSGEDLEGNLADSGSDLEQDHADYDHPGFIWGGGEGGGRAHEGA
ncbi:hypothetical protein LGH82_22815 [Mesorhizobium sp. PAMC28654]|uniref:hypothetical protein n=1 Tax=Mesorhizobium sp. PAMC28654 TaxID=2880934 RepID=UPI001D0A6CD6|nr:hypothetical protein [Mesorhizobium sp. PAMC28654]UDL87974.1 hypothetical protein LGH82_22815 [Mesorhizobium sp. PAMC28654]